MDTYRTVKGTSEGSYKEKGSKFLAFAFNARDENEVKTHLDGLRKKYFDARHHCYAYILGKDKDKSRANDDGEPNHSAGTPILNQIRSADLTNLLIVVVRYFGGVKLGVAGLIEAYKTAAAEAIANAEIVEEIVSQNLSFSFEYPAMNQVMKIVKDYGLDIIGQDFGMSCRMEVRIRESLLEETRPKFLEIETLTLL